MLPRRLALLGEGRGAADGGDEVDVAPSPRPAGGDDHALAGAREVGDVEGGRLGLGVELADDRSDRHAQHEVSAVAPVSARPLAVRPALGAEVVLVAEVDERGELGVGLYDDVAAVPPSPPSGPPLGT